MAGARWLIAALVGLAAMSFVMTPQWIRPWPSGARWWESPGFFPRIALALVVLFGLIELIRLWRGGTIIQSNESDASDSKPAIAIAVAVIVALQIALLPLLGFLASTFLASVAIARVGRLAWMHALGVGAGIALLLWAVFVQLLQVAFPHPQLLDLLG
ncbi:MAG: tripartite tricarboxylate transporter TctB family protein [Betaproteobacteria bacterium]|nr:tripartite tricarboxylate transporter TctB family protein [Betaproteobacteria bacterium]